MGQMRALVTTLWLAAACKPHAPTLDPPVWVADDAAAGGELTSALVAVEASVEPAAPAQNEPGDLAADVDRDTEYACFRSRDGRTGQWGQIAGFRTNTWRRLVERVDRGRGQPNADADRANGELRARIAARCAAHRDSACCAGDR
jgi:hypothetical protein